MSIVVQKFTNPNHAGNLFLVCSEEEFLIVDPCVNFSKIETEVQGKRCVGILLTHGHFDHMEEVESFLAQGFPIFLHRNALAKFGDPTLNCSCLFETPQRFDILPEQFKTVGEGDRIQVGSVTGTVLELPGHSDCCIGLVVGGHFFCGDFIFEGGNIGRYDLPTGSGQSMRQSLRKLKQLPPTLLVHPGHGGDFLLKDH